MAKPPRYSERDESVPAEGAEGPPGRDARPALDTHFLLLEVGKLTGATARLSKDLEKIDKKLDAISDDLGNMKHNISFMKGAIWVVGIFVILVGVAITWYINGKLAISVRPGP